MLIHPWDAAIGDAQWRNWLAGKASAMSYWLVACGPTLWDLGLWMPDRSSLTMQS